MVNAQIIAAKKTAGKMRTLIIKDQVIPFLTGTMQGVQTDIDYSAVNKGIVSIVHDAPQAMRLYYNPQFNFTKTFNPHAKGEWWEDYLSGDKKTWARKIFMEYYKREAGV